MKTCFLFCIAILLSNCNEVPIYSDEHKLPLTENIIRIEFKSAGNVNCEKTLFNEFQIINESRINEFLTILKKSKLDGPWKGACFDQINLVTNDTVVIISTNGKVFGHGSSGIFYRFPKDNVIHSFRLNEE